MNFGVGLTVVPIALDAPSTLDEIVYESNGVFEIVVYGGPFGAFEESVLVLVTEMYLGAGSGAILSTWESTPGSAIIFAAAEVDGVIALAYAEALDEASLTAAELILNTITLD